MIFLFYILWRDHQIIGWLRCCLSIYSRMHKLSRQLCIFSLEFNLLESGVISVVKTNYITLFLESIKCSPLCIKVWWKYSLELLFHKVKVYSTEISHVTKGIIFPSWLWRIYAIIKILCDREKYYTSVTMYGKSFYTETLLKKFEAQENGKRVSE